MTDQPSDAAYKKLDTLGSMSVASATPDSPSEPDRVEMQAVGQPQEMQKVTSQSLSRQDDTQALQSGFSRTIERKEIDLSEARHLLSNRVAKFAPFVKSWPNVVKFLYDKYVAGENIQELSDADAKLGTVFEWITIMLDAHERDIDQERIGMSSIQLKNAFLNFLADRSLKRPIFPMTEKVFNRELRIFFSDYEKHILPSQWSDNLTRTDIILDLQLGDPSNRGYFRSIGCLDDEVLSLERREDQHVLGEIANYVLQKGPGKTHYIPYRIPSRTVLQKKYVEAFQLRRYAEPDRVRELKAWLIQQQKNLPDNNSTGDYLLTLRVSRKQNPVLHWWVKFPGRVACVFSFIQVFPVVASLFVSGFAIFALRAYTIWLVQETRAWAFIFGVCAVLEIWMLIIIFVQLFKDVWLCIYYSWVWTTNIERRLIASCCKSQLLLDLGWFIRTVICLVLFLITLFGVSLRPQQTVGATARWQIFVETSLVFGFVLYIIFLQSRILRNIYEMYHFVQATSDPVEKWDRVLRVIRFRNERRDDLCRSCRMPMAVPIIWLFICPLLFGIVFWQTGASTGGVVLLVAIPYLSYMVWCFRAWYARSDKGGIGNKTLDEREATLEGMQQTFADTFGAMDGDNFDCCDAATACCKEFCERHSPRLAVLSVFIVFVAICFGIVVGLTRTTFNLDPPPYGKSGNLGAYPVCLAQTWMGPKIRTSIADFAYFSWIAQTNDWPDTVAAINKAWPGTTTCNNVSTVVNATYTSTSLNCTTTPFWKIVKPPDASSSTSIRFYHITDANETVNMIAIRSNDAISDFELFWNIFVLQVISYFIPVLKLWPGETTMQFVTLASGFQEFVTPQSSLNFYKTVEDYTVTVLANTPATSNHPLYLVGHSFGGAIGHVVATRLRERNLNSTIESIGINAPGIFYSSRKFGINQFRLIDKTTFTLVSDRAMYARIDRIVGTHAAIQCKAGLSSAACQSIPVAFCELVLSCGGSSHSPFANRTYYECVCQRGAQGAGTC